MSDPYIRISLADGQAKVRMGSGSIRVSRRDSENAPYQCPIELVAAALGS